MENPTTVDLTVTTIRFFWEPLLVVAIGVFVYLFRKSKPISEKTIDEINSKSVLGYAGEGYRPYWGVVVAGLGVLLFIAMNLTWMQQTFFRS
jgi:hypothetical protein